MANKPNKRAKTAASAKPAARPAVVCKQCNVPCLWVKRAKQPGVQGGMMWICPQCED